MIRMLTTNCESNNNTHADQYIDIHWTQWLAIFACPTKELIICICPSGTTLRRNCPLHQSRRNSIDLELTQAGTGIQCLAAKAPAVAIDAGGSELSAVVSEYTCSSLARGAGCLGIHQTNTEKDTYSYSDKKTSSAIKTLYTNEMLQRRAIAITPHRSSYVNNLPRHFNGTHYFRTYRMRIGWPSYQFHV